MYGESNPHTGKCNINNSMGGREATIWGKLSQRNVMQGERGVFRASVRNCNAIVIHDQIPFLKFVKNFKLLDPFQHISREPFVCFVHGHHLVALRRSTTIKYKQQQQKDKQTQKHQN